MKNESNHYDCIVFTEGKTDRQLIAKATEKLNCRIRIKYDDSETDKGDASLLDYCEKLSRVPLPNSLPMIFVFDRDNPEITKKVNEGIMSFKNWGKNVFSMSIPIPEHRKNFKGISIEHYFTDLEITTPDKEGRRLYRSKEFGEKGNYLNDEAIHYGNYNKLKGSTTGTSFKIIDSDVLTRMVVI